EAVVQPGGQAEASSWVGCVRGIAREYDSADPIAWSRSLMHAIGRGAVDPVAFGSWKYGAIHLGQPLEKAFFRKRCIFHVRATPQPVVIQQNDNGTELSVDHERGAGVAVALEIVVDVGGHKSLGPGHSVKRQSQLMPDGAARSVGANDPLRAQL